jgi:hypothetical protein
LFKPGASRRVFSFAGKYLKRTPAKRVWLGFQSPESFAGIYMRADTRLCRKWQGREFGLTQIPYIFQILTDGDPQLVHIASGRWGTSCCQENYFRKFRVGWPFSYSPEKGLNHNGFIKMCRCGICYEPVSANQIR